MFTQKLEEGNIKIGEMDFTTSQSQKESSIGHSFEGKGKIIPSLHAELKSIFINIEQCYEILSVYP